MADTISVHKTSELVHNGPGHVAGIVASTSDVAMGLSIYDGLDNTGTLLFELMFDVDHPVVIFMNDRFAPRFQTGCYLEMTDPVTVTIWCHKILT
jgi:hypothetical protein